MDIIKGKNSRNDILRYGSRCWNFRVILNSFVPGIQADDNHNDQVQ